MKKTLPIILTTALVTASTWATAAPVATAVEAYYAHKSPDKSGLDNFDLFGIYSYIGYKKHSLELAYDGQKSKAYGSKTPDDLTFAYTNYQLNNIKLKVGARFSDINDVVNPTTVALLGAEYTNYNFYGYKKWYTGLDLFYNQSSHTSASTSRSTKLYQPNAMQVSPYVGYYFGIKSRPYDSILLEAKVNYQDYDKNTNPSIDLKNSYMSSHVSLAYNTPKWSTTATVFTGESYNLVESSGFIYNNDYYTYQGAGKLAAKIGIGKTGFISPWVKYQTVKNTPNSNGAKALTTVGIAAGFSF